MDSSLARCTFSDMSPFHTARISSSWRAKMALKSIQCSQLAYPMTILALFLNKGTITISVCFIKASKWRTLSSRGQSKLSWQHWKALAVTMRMRHAICLGTSELKMMTHAKKVFHTICIIFARHDAFFSFPALMTWQLASRSFEQLNRFKVGKNSMGELIGVVVVIQRTVLTLLSF